MHVTPHWLVPHFVPLFSLLFEGQVHCSLSGPSLSPRERPRLLPFQGDVRTWVPVRGTWRPHCHFMVPSSDLFIESNQRKSMSMTFEEHLSILAHERKKKRVIRSEKGRLCAHRTRDPWTLTFKRCHEGEWRLIESQKWGSGSELCW